MDKNKNIPDEELKKLIQSPDVREYVRRTGWTFTDAQKATLLANGWIGDKPFEERLQHLRELMEKTEDLKLRGQIADYLERKERKLRDFKENQNRNFLYILKLENEEWEDNYNRIAPSGYFADWRMAWEYGRKGKCRFLIEKYCPEDTGEYGDDVTRTLYFGRTGEVIYLEYPKEEPAEESEERPDQEQAGERGIQETVGEQGFENMVFPLPNAFEAGDIVRRIGARRCDEYGIVESTREEDQKFWEKWKNGKWKGVSLDFGDPRIRVVFLQDDGTFSHAHIIPLYLEKYQPPGRYGDERNSPMDNLLLSASDLVRGNGGSLDELWCFTMEFRRAKNKRKPIG